ncbi:hypothetical protein [Rhizobium leguminosarum]|uniref:hypothetical protein n=1 Tax=Rhizobium leguminosarum TaxID=384 RepID=UPI001FDFDB2F|nr:hypothetical protein [Rhizobium leguminosarum]
MKPTKDEGLMASIMRVVKGNPDIQRALHEEERLSAQAERRPAIVAELQAARDAARKRIDKLAAAEVSALKELQAIEPRYEAVAVAWKNAKRTLDIERQEVWDAENRLLNELEANADPIIDETHRKLGELWNDFHYNRNKYAVTISWDVRPGRKGGQARPIVLSNAPSLERWRQAILDGLRDVPMMKRDPAQSNIAERCEAILASLPDWTEIVEVEP